MTTKVAKSRTLIKLDDKVIEIVEGKKGLKAKYLTDEEAFDVNVFEAPVEELVQNDLNKITNEAYKELQESFKNTLKTNVLKIVGFNNSWNNNWEVDHCNGRSSLLIEFMSEKVKAMFREEFNKMTENDIQKSLEPIKKIFIKEFKGEFERIVRTSAREAAYKEAEAFVKQLAAQQIQKYQKDLIKGVELSFLGRTAKPEDPEDN